jgi:TRAP-type uncharacterized transport system fused permease subunit
MWVALKICLPITLMTFAIFARTDMVVVTGWPQIAATALVIAGTCAVTFAMFGWYTRNRLLDIPLRIALAAFALVTLLHPDEAYAVPAAIVAILGTIAGIWRHRQIASPAPGTFKDDEFTIRGGEDLDNMAAEARRDIG